MRPVELSHADAAAAAAVLDATAIALLEYEIGPNAAVRLVRALQAADPGLVSDLLPGLDDEDDRLSVVVPEELAAVIADLATHLRVALPRAASAAGL